MQGVDPEKFTAFNVLEDEGLRSGALWFHVWDWAGPLGGFEGLKEYGLM
jgi:hypothetical protein